MFRWSLALLLVSMLVGLTGLTRVQADPTADDWLAIANQARAAHDWAKAVEACTAAIGLKPREALLYVERGRSYESWAKYDEAIADFDHALGLGFDRYTAYTYEANDYALKGDYQEAWACYQIAARCRHGNTDLPVVMSTGTVADLDKAVAAHPNDPVAYYKRGVAWASQGQFDRAIRDYTKAIGLKTSYADAYSSRALAWYFESDYFKSWADVKNCQAAGGQVKLSFLVALRKASGRPE